MEEKNFYNKGKLKNELDHASDKNTNTQFIIYMQLCSNISFQKTFGVANNQREIPTF